MPFIECKQLSSIFGVSQTLYKINFFYNSQTCLENCCHCVKCRKELVECVYAVQMIAIHASTLASILNDYDRFHLYLKFERINIY